MPVLRFLTSVFALIAVLALVSDATPVLYGTQAFKMTTIIGYWQLLAPASLTAAQAAVTRASFPWVWNPGIMSALNLPTPVLFGALAVVCGIFGRRRVKMKVHIN